MQNIETKPAMHAESHIHHAMSAAYSQSNQEIVDGNDLFIGPFPRMTLQKAPSTSQIASVSNSPAVDPGTTPAIDNDQVKLWSDKIKDALAHSVAAIVKVGVLLKDAKRTLPHGGFLKMLAYGLPFGPRQSQKYMKIASRKVLADPSNGAYLPRSVVQLSKLAILSDDILQVVVDDVKTRIAKREIINTDSPAIWRAYFDTHHTKPIRNATKDKHLFACRGQNAEMKAPTDSQPQSEHNLGKANPADSQRKSADEKKGSEGVKAVSNDDSVTAQKREVTKMQPGEKSVAEVKAQSDVPKPTDQGKDTDKTENLTKATEVKIPARMGHDQPQAANDAGNVVSLSQSVESEKLTAEELAVAEQLVATWMKTMGLLWVMSSYRVQATFIAWLQKDWKEEEVQESKAA